MAQKFAAQGKSVLMAAADTFRAAAIEQLEIWGQRAGCEVIRQKSGSDPSAVVFDALKAAKSRHTDVVLVDTAGRLHTKINLMEELKKVRRIMEREIPGAPHEVLLVLDATTGQNAIAQAKMFTQTVGVTGIVLSKLDGTAKGGHPGGDFQRAENSDPLHRHRRKNRRSAGIQRPRLCRSIVLGKILRWRKATGVALFVYCLSSCPSRFFDFHFPAFGERDRGAAQGGLDNCGALDLITQILSRQNFS